MAAARPGYDGPAESEPVTGGLIHRLRDEEAQDEELVLPRGDADLTGVAAPGDRRLLPSGTTAGREAGSCQDRGAGQGRFEGVVPLGDGNLSPSC